VRDGGENGSPKEKKKAINNTGARGREQKSNKRWRRRRNMGERREYPHGMRVRIMGGIFKKHGYVGEIAGSTRCMADVYVPVLMKREFAYNTHRWKERVLRQRR
jgi:hypothetical protein